MTAGGYASAEVDVMSTGAQPLPLLMLAVAVALSPIPIATGDRSTELLDRLKTWMAHNSGVIMAVILLLVGAKLLGDGIAGL